MSSALDRLAGSGKSLAAETPDANEFARLKHSGVTRLKDAANPVFHSKGASTLRKARRTLCA